MGQPSQRVGYVSESAKSAKLADLAWYLLIQLPHLLFTVMRKIINKTKNLSKQIRIMVTEFRVSGQCRSDYILLSI